MMSYAELLGRIAPELALTIAALVVMGVDLVVMREEPLRNRFWVCAGFAILGCLVAGAWLLVIQTSPPEIAPGGLLPSLVSMFVDDPLTRLVKLGLIVLSVCTMVISFDGNFTRHVGEYLALILFATIGMMLLVSSTDLLMIFLSLELTSLSLYVLVAFNKQDLKSSEAALKYFLFGGVAAAFALFGLSLIYGLAGSTNLKQIAAALSDVSHPPDPLLAVAMILTVVGFGFKVAVVPFHLWAPDAYQGAPMPSAALIASGSKLAGFFVFARVMMVAFAKSSTGWNSPHFYEGGWLALIAALAALSMLVGNLAAIVQSDVKRLLAYSAIAHAGYALVGLLANNGQGVSAIIFYMMTYGLTVVGAFGVVSVVEQGTGGAKLADFAGLYRRAPHLSLCMMVFMLSLAGIPPLAGFFGKFYLFTAAVGSRGTELSWLSLVIFGVAMSAVSLYYYLQVLKQIFVVNGPTGQSEIQTSPTSKVVLVALALGVVLLGCAPNLLLGRLLAAIQSFML
jgi:NADH-quinone oxidoreductase subunit N